MQPWVTERRKKYRKLYMYRSMFPTTSPVAITVAVNKKFTFRLRTTIVLRSVPFQFFYRTFERTFTVKTENFRTATVYGE